MSTSTSTRGRIVTHVLVVAFHHTLGPILEWAHPGPAPPEPTKEPDRQLALPPAWTSLLPFCALPDGSHSSDNECICAFHLPPPSPPPTADANANANWWWATLDPTATVFAVSCLRKIASSELINKTPDITRQFVQKAVVILSTQPVYGLVRDKLSLVTSTYFAQRDFTNKDIIKELYESFENLCVLQDYQYYIGLGLRNFILKFKKSALLLFKMLLVQKKILFYSTNIENLVSTQYSLISLFPNLLFNLRCCGSLDLDAPRFSAASTPHLRINDCVSGYRSQSTDAQASKYDVREAAAMPPPLFGRGALFQAYLPLQQLVDLERSRCFVAGVSNTLLCEKPPRVDAIVFCDDGHIEYPEFDTAGENGNFSKQGMTSTADRKWISDMLDSLRIPSENNDNDDAEITPITPAKASLSAANNMTTTTTTTTTPPPNNNNSNNATTTTTTTNTSTTSHSSSKSNSIDNIGSNNENNAAAAAAAAAGAAAKRAKVPNILSRQLLEDADYDNHIRAQFEDYLLRFVATLIYRDEIPLDLAVAEGGDSAAVNRDRLLEDFGELFVEEFMASRTAAGWLSTVDSRILDMVDIGHPCEGYDRVRHLEDRFQKTKTQLQTTLSNAMVSGSKIMEKMVAKVKEEAAKRQASSSSQAADSSASKTEPEKSTKSSAGSGSGSSSGSAGGSPAGAVSVASRAKDLGNAWWSSASNYISAKKAELKHASNASESAGGVVPDATASASSSPKKRMDNVATPTVLYSAPSDEEGAAES